MTYKGYIKLEHEVEAENEEQAKEKIADYWDDALLAGFDSSSVELESENKGEYKHGHWEEDGHGHIICSACKEANVSTWKSRFCPMCGAGMRGADNECDN